MNPVVTLASCLLRGRKASFAHRIHGWPTGPAHGVRAHLDSQVSLASLQDDKHLILLYCLGLPVIRPTDVTSDPSILWQE